MARATTDTPSAPTDPLAISDVDVLETAASSVRITWRTNVPARTLTAFGLDAPAIWMPPDGDAVLEHESVLEPLEPATTYHAYLRAGDEWNRTETTAVTFTTAPMPERSSAHTNFDRIVVDGRVFFPTAVWEQCSNALGSNVADGINLFMGLGCHRRDIELPHLLDGRAYSLVDTRSAAALGRGVIGWYYPDEWDAFVESSVTRDDLRDAIVEPRAGRIGFLTLTNHFYSRAEPLPQGKGMYPVLLSIPDVIGFDLYPLQGWCRPAFGDVFDAQHELQYASGGKPTFQWIEVAVMEQACGRDRTLDPTPTTVRAETWLAIAGGAKGIGYFPSRWSSSIGAEIARTNRAIRALTPALMAAMVPAGSDIESVRVAAHTLDGAQYVIAVNASHEPLRTRISVDGLAGRAALVYGEDRVVASDERGFSDTFAPLAAHVYVIPPRGW